MSKRKSKNAPTNETPPPPPSSPAPMPRESSPDTERPPEAEKTGEHAAVAEPADAAADADAEAIREEPIAEDAHEPRLTTLDPDTTLDLRGDDLAAMMAARDDLAEPTANGLPEETTQTLSDGDTAQSAVARAHLMGLIEALVFASDKPIKTNELAKAASATLKETKSLLAELKSDYATRGVQLDEVAGGWIFRTNPQYAPFVRDLSKQKPVRLSRAQVETLAILAYRQPITRPEIDEIRGVDCGAVLKLLLERDLVKILGKKDEPGRPILYGTTTSFLEFFGLKSLKDLPTLREFTELNEDSRRVVEQELGDALDERQPAAAPDAAAADADTAQSEIEAQPTDPKLGVAAPVAFEEAAEDAPTDPPATDEAEDREEERAQPAVRVPGAWERAADGDEDDEDDDEDDDDDEDEDDDDEDEDDDDDDDEDEDDDDGRDEGEGNEKK